MRQAPAPKLNAKRKRYTNLGPRLIRRRYTICSCTLLLILFMAGDTGSIIHAGAEPLADTPHPASIVNMTSPYMNEKGQVKAYHRDISFHFISWDNTSQKSYLIMADTIILAEGNFTEYKIITIRLKQRIIMQLKVYIDDNLSLQRSNMVIYNQEQYGAPTTGGGEGAFLGYTWTQIQAQRWLIFRAVVVGVFISLFLTGRILQYYYRKRMGEEIIVSSI